MTPAVVLEMFASGLPKLSWLSRLKISALNSTRARPTGNRLLRDRLTSWVPGPRTVLRPAVPCVPSAGTAYALGSNHLSDVGLSISPKLPGVTRFTRCGTNEPHWQTLVEETVNGKPEARRMMPWTCQPP